MAIAASLTAMNAIVASSTAMNAIADSSTAMRAMMSTERRAVTWPAIVKSELACQILKGRYPELSLIKNDGAWKWI
ncbi:hypothetical protein, partial [Candidatus Regiella insecticola]|uniref:hypothetical protein n=1 Tax=Candidatus Regiella insecticola TaxID=138073 RepID=UPI0012FE813E